tara:strand:- start:130558 stop:130758 length:201 start_codon:yes stop_codon:yes gene_type:complete
MHEHKIFFVKWRELKLPVIFSWLCQLFSSSKATQILYDLVNSSIYATSVSCLLSPDSYLDSQEIKE